MELGQVSRFVLFRTDCSPCFVCILFNLNRFYYNDHNVYDEWDISLLNLPARIDDESSSSVTKSLEHLTAPSDEQVDRFIKSVREKWYVCDHCSMLARRTIERTCVDCRSEDPLQLVGVVSLYGYNRSGKALYC